MADLFDLFPWPKRAPSWGPTFAQVAANGSHGQDLANDARADAAHQRQPRLGGEPPSEIQWIMTCYGGVP